MQWEGKVGPGALLALAQLGVLGVGIVYGYAKLENTATNTAATTTTLREIIVKQRERTDSLNDRMIKVETVVTNIASSINKFDSKLDQVIRKP